MMIDFKSFVLEQAINHDLLENQDAQSLFNYLSLPKTVANIIVFTDLGLPALSGIASTLEKNFGTSEEFPLSNDTNRQIVGKMIRFILEFYGYSPISNASSSDKQLRDFSNATLFKSSAIYEKSHAPKLELVLNSKEYSPVE